MPSLEIGRIEKRVFFENKDRLKKAIFERNFLIEKINSFKIPLEKYKIIIGTKQAERLFLKIDRLIEELKKIKPIKIIPGNHFAHIIGQFQARAGWVERMERVQNEGKEEKILKCREILDEVIPAFSDFLDISINNKDYFQGELGNKNGYFEENEIQNGQKIHSLDACEFAFISKEYLLEMEKEKDIVKGAAM